MKSAIRGNAAASEMAMPAEWVRSAVRLLSPPGWLEGQHHYQRARACKTVSHPANVSTESRRGFANSGRGSLFLIVVQGWKLQGRCLPATTPNAPGRRHCSESERRYPASIHAVCLEKPLAAVRWVGVSRYFFTYLVAYCVGP